MNISRKEIERRYKELTQNIEETKIYDGRGIYDEYYCVKCKRLMFTTCKDKGFIPLIMRCKDCGDMIMQCDRHKIKPDLEIKQWVRPTLEQVFKLHNEGLIEYVLNGGLLLEEEL